MAWVQRSSSGRYIAKYRDGDGKVRTAPGGPFTHKKAAERAGEAAEATSRSLGWRSPDAAARTWGAWSEEWWRSRDVEPSTLATDHGRRDRHLMPRWGATPLVDITRHDVKAWAVELREAGLAPTTVQRIVHLLSASLHAAVDAEILTANPAARLRLNAGKASAERYLTHDEVDAIRAELPDAERAMVDLLVGTGMRWGEAIALHRPRVDLERRVVQVVDVWDNRGGVMKPYPKGKRTRDVPLPSWVEIDEPGAGTCGYDHAKGACTSKLVATTADGYRFEQSNFRKVWVAALRAAGVEHARVHDLRHTYASWLIQGAVSLAEVGKLLGHVSPLTTQRYAHLADEPSATVLAALGDSAPRALRPSEPGRTRGHLSIVR
ncbi:tyrosine-type recombinase/integrase [Cellulosimicrobium cellulans]